MVVLHAMFSWQWICLHQTYLLYQADNRPESQMKWKKRKKETVIIKRKYLSAIDRSMYLEYSIVNSVLLLQEFTNLASDY